MIRCYREKGVATHPKGASSMRELVGFDATLSKMTDVRELRTRETGEDDKLVLNRNHRESDSAVVMTFQIGPLTSFRLQKLSYRGSESGG